MLRRGVTVACRRRAGPPRRDGRPGLRGRCASLPPLLERLGAGAALVAFLLHSWACTGASSGEGLAAVPRDRTLVLMNGGPYQYSLYDNQNPYIPGSDQGFHFGTLPAVFEPLIMFNVLTGEHENWLAEDWEYGPDYRAITLTLRPGIRWNDGVPFTSRDVAFTFDLLKEHAGSMVHVGDVAEFFERAVVIDERTVRLELTKPGPAFWATTLSTNHGVHILPEHVWRGVDPLEFTNHDIARGWPVGTGPYRLAYASPYQKVYDRRADWWAAQTGFKTAPQVERVVFVPQQEESQAAQLMLTDELDVGPILQVSTLKAVIERNPKVVTFAGQAPPYGYLDWCPIDLTVNCAAPPYDRVGVRRALALAFDRERLVELSESGAGVPALHPFTPYAWFAPFEGPLGELIARHGYDTRAHPERVVELMEAEGYRRDGEGFWADGRGERLRMNVFVPQFLRAYGPPLVQQLRDAGFDATFDTSPGLASLTQTGEHPVFLGCKGPSGVRGMDPYFMLAVYHSQFFRPTGKPAPLWWATSRWRHEEYDRVVERMAPLQVGDEALLPLFLEAMDIWLSQMPDIYLAQLIIRYPLNTARWRGWPSQESPYGFPHSWQWELLKTFLRLEPATAPTAGCCAGAGPG